MKYFCRKCWRSGELPFEMPEVEALRNAALLHRRAVDLDMRAVLVPAGCEGWANAPIMERYPAVDCAGDLKIGEPPRKRGRFDRKQVPRFDFEGE
jgi:hypothetical protein